MTNSLHLAPGQETLTAEQEALLDNIAEESIAILQRLPAIRMDVVKETLENIYTIDHNLSLPEIEILDSPIAARKRAQELTGQDCQFDWIGISDCGWTAKLEAFRQLGAISDEEFESTQTRLFFDFARCGVWDTILLDERALVVRMPTLLQLDEAGDLHCQDGPCIQWSDGLQDWSWHGVWVPERLIMDPDSYTAEEYRKLPAEQRRALGERLGWDNLAKKLGFQVLDEATIDDLDHRLILCEDGTKLLDMQSPVLQDGSQPRYCEPVHEDLHTVAGARKWRVTNGREWTPERCEDEPQLNIINHG